MLRGTHPIETPGVVVVVVEVVMVAVVVGLCNHNCREGNAHASVASGVCDKCI
jgi:hypothetical protein